MSIRNFTLSSVALGLVLGLGFAGAAPASANTGTCTSEVPVSLVQDISRFDKSHPELTSGNCSASQLTHSVFGRAQPVDPLTVGDVPDNQPPKLHRNIHAM